jgi:hypothetical protein
VLPKSNTGTFKALRAALEKGNIGQTQEAQKSKVHILENLTASHCYLEQNSKFHDSLLETSRRQNLTYSLTSITDEALPFFTLLEQKRLCLYAVYRRVGSLVLKHVESDLMADPELLNAFRSAVESETEEVSETFVDFVRQYLHVTDNEFRKQLLSELGKKKTMEHRKSVQTSSKRPRLLAESISVSFVQNASREAGIEKLRAFLVDGSFDKLKKSDMCAIADHLFDVKLPVKLNKSQMKGRTAEVIEQRELIVATMLLIFAKYFFFFSVLNEHRNKFLSQFWGLVVSIVV